jgi:hypothetical protein
MNLLRSILFGTIAAGGMTLVGAMPAQADPDVGFYIGPDGARVYYDDYDRDDYYHRPYRRCFVDTWYTWRFGERVRVVDRICYNRWGRRRLVDRDYYPVYDWRW